MFLTDRRRLQLERTLLIVRHRRLLVSSRLDAKDAFWQSELDRLENVAEHWRLDSLCDRLIAILGHDPLHIECESGCPGRTRKFVAVVSSSPPVPMAPVENLFIKTEIEEFVDNMQELIESPEA